MDAAGRQVVTRHEVQLHGHRMSYLQAGPADGPVLVLVHGLASEACVWADAMGILAEAGVHVLAPDLFGHGRSAKPPTDYSVAGFSNTVRDLLVVLGHPTATVGGHSLGGGVAVQFLYQYPERCERIVLVAPGGMGRDVHPVLRLAAAPGARTVLRLLVNAWTVAGLSRVRWLAGLLGIPQHARANLARALRGLATTEGRAAFFATLDFIIGPAGQRVSALDKLYLADHLPVLIVSSARDSTIPIHHARHVNARLPRSRLVVLPGRTHEPHRRQADAFTRAVVRFLADTTPAPVDSGHLARRLATGGEPRPYWT